VSTPLNDAPTTLRPTDLASLRDAVLDTPGRLAVAGAGTAADWAGRLRAVDAVLDVTGLSGVIVHNPGDMTVSVHAGTPLRALNEELAPHGQQVSLDAARVTDGATVGGLIATGDAGPSALVHGTLRDLVIGVTLVLADGTVARSGGHVIKNVAGYDLSKLLHGSYGTLAVIAEVVLRLHPVPQRSATVTVDCPLEEAAARARRVLASPLEPVALEWVSGTPGRLLVRVEGTPDALSGRLGRVVELLGEGATETAGEIWDTHARLTRGPGPDAAVLRVGTRPGRLPDLLDALPVTAATVGLGTGVATVTLPGAAVAQAHRTVHTAGGTSVLRRRATDLDAPAWGPPPSALPVLAAVKRGLDPDGRLGPGRFDPWELP
jgi:glycolate oxidase FAD binding subunit